MRILYIIDHLGAGGTQKMLLILADELIKKGYQIIVISLGSKNLYSSLFENNGINVYYCNIDIVGSPTELKTFFITIYYSLHNLINALYQIIKIIRKFKPHVIMTLLFGADLYGIIAGIICRKKVICAIRATNIWMRWWHKIICRLSYPFVDIFTTNATRTREYMHTSMKLPYQKIVNIFNCVKIDNSLQLTKKTRNTFGISDSTYWIVSAGRLDAQKGFSTLITAAEIIIASNNSVVISIFGDGILKNELKKQITALGLNKQIKLEGYYNKLNQVFAAADLFVLPSLFEGMPNVLLEAMSMKTPVIATNVDGVGDVIKHNINGLIIEPENPEELSIAVMKLINNKQLSEFLSQNGYNKVTDTFSIKVMCERYHQLYKQIIQKQVYLNAST